MGDRAKVFEIPAVKLVASYLSDIAADAAISKFIDAACEAGVSNDFSVRKLLDLLESLGLQAFGGSLDRDDVDGMPTPTLTYLDDAEVGGACLAYVSRRTANGVYIRDFSGAEKRISAEEFASRWLGVCVRVPGTSGSAPNALSRERDEYQNRIQLFRQFVGPGEVAEVLELCRGAIFKQSEVGRAYDGGIENVVIRKARSSATALLDGRDHPVLAKIIMKCAEIAGEDPDMAELVQCTRYRKGQRFNAHFDSAFGLPRKETFLLYLNDDFSGGETYFPRLDLRVRPESGMCLRFPNIEPDGTPLWNALHCGLPISDGEKFVINVWIRPRAIQRRSSEAATHAMVEA